MRSTPEQDIYLVRDAHYSVGDAKGCLG